MLAHAEFRDANGAFRAKVELGKAADGDCGAEFTFLVTPLETSSSSKTYAVTRSYAEIRRLDRSLATAYMSFSMPEFPRSRSRSLCDDVDREEELENLGQYLAEYLGKLVESGIVPDRVCQFLNIKSARESGGQFIGQSRRLLKRRKTLQDLEKFGADLQHHGPGTLFIDGEAFDPNSRPMVAKVAEVRRRSLVALGTQRSCPVFDLSELGRESIMSDLTKLFPEHVGRSTSRVHGMPST